MGVDISNESIMNVGSGVKSFTFTPLTAIEYGWNVLLPACDESFTLTVHTPVEALAINTTSTLFLLSFEPPVVDLPLLKSLPK